MYIYYSSHNIQKGLIYTKRQLQLWLILRLHYGHGGHVSDDREQNGITVRRRRGTGLANVARRDNRGHRDKFFDSLKICHGSHGGNEKRNGP